MYLIAIFGPEPNDATNSIVSAAHPTADTASHKGVLTGNGF